MSQQHVGVAPISGEEYKRAERVLLQRKEIWIMKENKICRAVSGGKVKRGRDDLQHRILRRLLFGTAIFPYWAFGT